MWVLVLAISWGGVVVPGHYETKELCIAAGKEYAVQRKARMFVETDFFCIPAPTK